MSQDKKIKIGVLALQGAFVEHIHVLKRLPQVSDAVPIRTPEEFQGSQIDALVIPGGESTSIALVAERSGLLDHLRNWVKSGKPTWGTCAGMILLSNHATHTKLGGQKLIGGLDVVVQRNAFGAQVDSFSAPLTIDGVAGEPFPAVFIRAPIIESVGSDVEVIARLDASRDERIVAVKQGHLLATAFHPELTSDDRFHRLFVEHALAHLSS
ncbi:PdxT/SNO family [Polychytrium aggregatum]|uniref:PdxT/SNO family n=1 Tax=Polychytrium aggregatum TaxID=110093 RepID=UPI0022FDC0DC|nr:PdxT/SNO family [Polychytrium aggregatum]KAI9209019.1 PdxT/SNO family [Polychytrium aggregatum]